MGTQGLAERYRISQGSGFRLKQADPDDTAGIRSKDAAEAALTRGVERLAELQELLYAEDRWSLLLVFQARA